MLGACGGAYLSLRTGSFRSLAGRSGDPSSPGESRPFDLGSKGFPLVGGRLDYLQDRPVAALVYQRRKHVINLFIWPSPGNFGEKVAMRQGYNIHHWVESGMTFWAVSDLNNSELEEFVQLIRAES